MFSKVTFFVVCLCVTVLKFVTTEGIDPPPVQVFSAIGAKRLHSNSLYNVSIFVEPSAQSQLTFQLHLKSYELYSEKPLPVENDNATDYDYSEPTLVPVNATVLASSESVSFQPGESGTVGIQIPDLPGNIVRYNLTMTAVDSSGTVFEDFNMVVRDKVTKTQSLLVQSDKVIYKPGETVKYRVLLLDPTLRPLSNQTVDVTITDAQQNVIKILTEQKIVGGLFRSELKLSQEPVQGDWKLEAKVNNQVTSHVFTIEEYVLPKFKVDILPPPYITFDEMKLVVEVRAAYTFGKKMAGECQIQISEVLGRWSNREPKRITKTAPLDGSAFFEVDVQTDIERGNKLYSEKSYEISATVTEGLTGRKVNASSVTVRAYRYPHKIEQFQPSGKFKPGLPFTFKFKISTQDGYPMADSNSSAVEFRHGFACLAEEEFMFSSLPTNGIASFIIPKMPTNERMALAQVQVTYKGQTVQFYSPSRHISPTRSYMDLSLSSATVAAGSQLQLEVRSTKIMSSLTVVLYGRGQVVSSRYLTFDPTMVHNVSIPVVSLAGPTAQILVYTILKPSLEVVAEAREITVTNYFDNFLSLQLSKSQAEPGDKVSLALKTNAGSLVLLRGVDQSVLILKPDKDITSVVVESELKEFLPPADTNRLRGGSSTFQTFDETGVVIFTNSNLEREKIRSRGWSRASSRVKHTKVTTVMEEVEYEEMVELTFDDDVDQDSVPAPRAYNRKQTGNREPKALKVRKEFPETWIWDEIQTNQSETTLEKVVPDTLTSWVISGYALNTETGIGVLPRSLTLKTFRPFFLTLNKPYSIVKGEIFGLQILVHNYLEVKVTASVTLKNQEGMFEFYNARNKSIDFVTEEIDLEPSEVKSVTMVIRPTKFGVMKLDATVTCAVAADAVSQTLIVKPPGQKQERNKAVLLDLRQQTTATETLTTEFPPHRVDGADKVKISVISDLLGSSVKNLDKLLKMPYGCGEQNMVTFVPDIVILEYLKAVGKLTDDIKTKATQFLESGYQRELNYLHDDGSFSAFGKSDSHGSTWLTAFVVRSFVAAQPHITVDKAVIEKALTFLSGKQHENGTFAEDGRVLHSEMKGGATDDYSLTAYVLLAFFEANTGTEFDFPKVNFDAVISKGLAYLTTAKPEELGVYSLTLLTYALQAANSTLKQSFHDQLEKLATREGGLTYWEPPKDSNRSQARWEPSTKPLAVEMTAYSLLTYLRDDDLDKALNTGKWLLTQRNAEGGFISTQDTVVGLDALAKFALATYSSDVDLTIEADQIKFEVNANNAMVLQEVLLPSSTNSVTFEANGKGSALVQLSWSYYVENESSSPAFAIDVKVEEGEVKGSLKLIICATYESAEGKKKESNMAVVEANLPSGYVFEREEVVGVQVGPGVKRTDLDEGATRLNIYFDYLDSIKRCLVVPAVRVFKVADPAPAYVSVYDYYDTTRRALAFYTPPGLSATQITCESKDGASGDNCL